MNITIELYKFRIVLVPNFSLNWQFEVLWTKLTEKNISDLKRKKMKIAIEFYIFKLVQVLNLNFNKQFKFFGTNFPPKKDTSGKKQKSKHHHWILHIRISLSSYFQLNLTTLIFWIKFPQKGISSLKQIKATPLFNSAYSN